MENQYQQQNQYPQQGQYQNQYYNPMPAKNQPVVSIGDWIVTLLIRLIPIVSLVMLFVWAFGGGTPESKANWAKAVLIFHLIGIVIAILFWGTIGTLLISAFR
jgi:uncharacterized membrane protein YdbT with pleckstrin-like domain